MTLRMNRRDVLLGASALAAGSFLATCPSWTQSGETSRKNHALIIAVTEYPELPPSAKLIGPNNDAQLVREFLTTSSPVRFEPANVTVLADGLDNATSPTRNAIRAALDDLAQKVGSGDFVYLQFSGHGAQQPAMDPSIEPDGLDEIFLPRDTGMWKDRTKGVPNALIDKEIRDHLQAIRDKGAFIWTIFDCCHSGTMTRAAGLVDGEEVDRKIHFNDLGITDEVMAEAVAQSDSATRGFGEPAPRQNALGMATPTGATSMAPGGLVAFFAAQTTETTPEMPLPRGSENPTRLGLFTYTLLSKIAENPAMTYRQLGQAVLQSYTADNRTRPTPLFEGDLDKPVFGTSSVDRIAQWPLKVDGNALQIPAGQIHRLTPGAKLAILPLASSPIEDAVGYLEVTSATNLSSQVRPVAHVGLPALGIADIPAGAYARLTELTIGFELVVARPNAEESEEAKLINEALDTIASAGTSPVNLRFVDATADADVKIAVMSEMDMGIMIADQLKGEAENAKVEASRASLGSAPRVWLLPPSAELSLDEDRRAPSLPLDGLSVAELTEKLAETLVTIFRATSLARLAAASDFRDEEVHINFKILSNDTGQTEPLAPGSLPIVHPDDQVHLAARNGSSKPVDINVLYIGSDYSISHMYAERLVSGAEIDLPLLAFNGESYGMERMVVVLSEAAPQTPVEDLSFLEQVGVRNQTRAAGVGSASFGDLLRDVANAPATRGAARIGEKAAGSRGAVMIFPMENRPRA